MVVREDTRDILRSKLWSSRSLCEEREILNQNESLRVIEDFLREALEPSNIVKESREDTQSAIARIDELKSDFEAQQHSAQKDR
jgi:hypothetical protein